MVWKSDFQRDGIPVYFFQKSEIEAAMRAADDRHYNQLVVDEEGSIRILSDHENGLLYPVQLEGWNARKQLCREIFETEHVGGKL